MRAVPLTVFIFLGAAMLSAQQPPAAVVFTSGFEEGSKAIWDDYDGNPDATNLLMEHPGPFNSPGNHVMRFRVPPGRGGADLVKILPGSYDKLYLRWYQMWESGYDFTARNHGSGLYAGSRNLLGRSDIRPNGSDLYCSYFEPADGRMNLYTYYRGMYMDCANPNGACWGDHFPCWLDEGERICEKAEHRETILPPIMESGKWYCFEIMLDAGTPVQYDSLAGGMLDFWIDGVEYGPWQHLWFRTTSDLKLNILWLSLFHHAEHSVEGILFDDVVVATERVGCGQTQSAVSEENLPKSFSLEVFPNPGNGRYTVVLHPGTQKDYTVTVTNTLGRRIFEQRGAGNDSPQHFDVDLSREPAAVYLLTVLSEGKRETARIVHR